MPFFVPKNANFVIDFANNPKFCQFFTNQKYVFFFSDVTAVNSFYEVLPKQF